MKKIFLLLLTFFLGSHQVIILAQNCNPDITPPIHLLKGTYGIYNSSNSQIIIEAQELVINAIDDCTDRDKLVHAFSTNKQDLNKTLSINDPYPKTIQVYTIDESGNYTIGSVQVIFKPCPSSIACNNEVNISVVPGKSTKISVDMLLTGAICRDRTYTIERQVSNNSWVILDEVNDQSPLQFTYRVTDNSNGNSCWGIILINSYDCNKVNEFNFIDLTSQSHCSQETSPESIGFPIVANYKILSKPSSNSYIIELVKNCPSINIEYSDKVITGDCSNFPLLKIIRTWTAKLPNGTIKSKDQIIDYRIAFDPSTYLVERVFNCSDSYNRIPGTDIPTIEETGKPIIDACESTNRYSSSFEDAIINVQDDNCLKVIKVIRKWTVLNWCTGDVQIYNQVIKISCSKDQLKPIPNCLGTLNLSLDHLGEANLYASDCDAGSIDNCNLLKFAFDAQGNSTTIKFNQSHIGVPQIVKLYVIDIAGNYDYCDVTILISNPGSLGKKSLIKGNLLNVVQEPLQKVSANFKFQLKSDNNQYNLNLCPPDNGYNYKLCIDSSANLTQGKLFCTYNNNNSILNGISTLDFVTILKGLFGLSELNKLQRIAADVDCNNEVNIFDLFDIRRIILGSISKFKCQDDILFYTSDLNNPRPIQDVDLTLPKSGQDIVVIKKGDVNGNSLLGLQSEVITSRNGISTIFIDEIEMQANQEYDIWLRVPEKVKIYGIQIGQIFDKSKVQLLELSSPYFSTQLGYDYVINDIDWRAFLMNVNTDLVTISEGFIKLKVQAKVKTKVSDAIYSNRYPLPLLVIDEDINISETYISPKVVATKNLKETITEFKIEPNPSHADIRINWMESIHENIFFKIIDSKGSTIYQLDNVNRSTGLLIPSSTFPQQGIYFLQIRHGKNLVTKKIVRI